jgi:hypothetical protein
MAAEPQRLAKPRQSVAWPLPQEELIVSPKMTSFTRAAVQQGERQVPTRAVRNPSSEKSGS